MPKDKPKIVTVEDYVALLPENARKPFAALRAAIKANAPRAEEVISYQMPALKLGGMLIYYSAAKDHLAVSFPSYAIFQDLKADLEPYETGRSSIKFPLDKAVPAAVIKKIVAYRIAEVAAKKPTKRG